MDRIHDPTKSSRPEAEEPTRSTFSIESALFSPGTPESSRAMFAPMHYESGYAYPLVVWLHGSSNDEHQLMRVMPMVSMRNYAAVAPRGFHPSMGEPDAEGYGWPQTPDHIEAAQQRIFDSISAVEQKLHIAPNRIFLVGFDSGGTMAFRIAMNYPRRFAGVMSLCGPFPTGHTPFIHLPEARKLPIFLAFGRDSRKFPPAKACENLRLFHTAGMSITLRQYPCSHQLTPQMLRDVDRWIIEQITAMASSMV